MVWRSAIHGTGPCQSTQLSARCGRLQNSSVVLYSLRLPSGRYDASIVQGGGALVVMLHKPTSLPIMASVLQTPVRGSGQIGALQGSRTLKTCEVQVYILAPLCLIQELTSSIASLWRNFVNLSLSAEAFRLSFSGFSSVDLATNTAHSERR